MAKYTVKSTAVWAGDILNRPGMLARVLEALENAGADLEFSIARRINERTSRVFVAPLKGRKQKAAAADVGLVPATGTFAIRIEGADRAGLAARLSRAMAAADLNIRGFSAAALGRKAVLYFAFRSEDEAKRAGKLARRELARKGKK